MVSYELKGDGEAPNYFYVDPESGTITLRESVLKTSDNVYRVSTLCYHKYLLVITDNIQHFW